LPSGCLFSLLCDSATPDVIGFPVLAADVQHASGGVITLWSAMSNVMQITLFMITIWGQPHRRSRIQLPGQRP
jgi:hypothetical protein